MKRNNCINNVDVIKFICCILIIGSHCLPLFVNDTANYYYGQWFFRFCVPFFFIATGYFFSKMEKGKQKSYIKRIIIIYLISTIIYLPLSLRGSFLSIASNLVFGYWHLWYLSALAIGLILVFLADKLLHERKYWLILALVGGVLLDEYYKLFDTPFLSKAAYAVEYIGGARHALLFAMPLLLIGGCIGTHEDIIRKEWRNQYIVAFVVIFALSFIESTLLKNTIGMDITTDATIFGWMPAVPLLLLGLSTKSKLPAEKSRRMRKITDVVYIIHIWPVVLLTKVIGMEYFGCFLIVTIVSFAIGIVFVIVGERIKRHRRIIDG